MTGVDSLSALKKEETIRMDQNYYADSAVQFCCYDVSGDSPLLVKPRFHMTLSEMSFDTSDTERFDLIRFDENECSKI